MMEEINNLPEHPKTWKERISKYILEEGKFSDSKKVQTHAKKLGEAFTQNISERSPENIYINYVVSICESLFPATHIAKITHSSSNGAAFVESLHSVKKESYISSGSTIQTIDGSYDNAALSGYVKFLLLEHQGVILFQELSKENCNILDDFQITSSEATEWYKKLNERLLKKPQSDALTKQAYFPVRDNYHLLQILKSSSLLQGIHLTYFEKEARKPYEKSKKQYQKTKFSEDYHVSFPQMAKLKTVQSQPQNVSVLNGARGGGKINLFSAKPPSWKNSLKPPQGPSLFYSEFNYYSQTKTCLDILAAYLVGYEIAGLSERHPDRYSNLHKMINQLVDGVCDYASRIHELPAGWSEKSKLKPSQQYWLDPLRDDADFQGLKAMSNYKKEIVLDFANWVNQQITKREKGLNLGTEHKKLWVKMAQKNFRQYNELID